MKGHPLLLAGLTLGLVLTGILVLQPGSQVEPLELTAKEASAQRGHPMRTTRAVPVSVGLLREKIARALEAAAKEPDREQGKELLRQSFLDLANADLARAVAFLQNEQPTEL